MGLTVDSQTEVNPSPPQQFLITPATSFNASSQVQPLSPPVKSDDSQHSSPKARTPYKKRLTGAIIPRQPVFRLSSLPLDRVITRGLPSVRSHVLSAVMEYCTLYSYSTPSHVLGGH